MIKVIIADDHQVFLDGMRVLLEQDDNIKIIGEALNGNQVLEILSEAKVDVVVLDIDMPELDGLETARMINNQYPKVKVLILTASSKKGDILKVLKYNAAGYVLKNKSIEQLVQAIHQVHGGNSYYGSEVMDAMVNRNNIHYDEEGTLTPREKEVLIKIAEGLTSKEIGKALHISETTVSVHRRNILSKLNISSIALLTRYAVKHGYVDN